MATLQKLGEDIELVLRQLLYGTVRRSLRAQIADEMKSNGYLGTHELHMLEKISLVEVCFHFKCNISSFNFFNLLFFSYIFPS